MRRKKPEQTLIGQLINSIKVSETERRDSLILDHIEATKQELAIMSDSLNTLCKLLAPLEQASKVPIFN